jgi:hypothetical protein
VRRGHKLAKNRNAYHDWQRIVYTTILLLVLILAVAIFLFWGVDHDILFKPKASSESIIPSVDRTAITKVSSFYSDRENVVNNLKASSTPAVDPSL